MASGGYSANINALNETAQGINDSIAALQSCGAITETAGVGLGFQDLNLSQEQLGYMELTNAVSGFTSRWAWGVRALVQDGNQIAQRLNLNAGAYAAAENNVIGSLKYLAVEADPLADPHETQAQAAAGGWNQYTALITGATTPEGKMTAQQAAQQISEQWKTEWTDIEQNGYKSPILDPLGAPVYQAVQLGEAVDGKK